MTLFWPFTASDNAGGIHHRDMRSPIATARRWNIEENKKIGSFSLNPMNPNYAVTAHLKNNMRLLDLRMIQTYSQTKSTDVAQLATFSHGAACSSAYFDPNGTKIVSTSYDDQIRSTSIVWHCRRLYFTADMFPQSGISIQRPWARLPLLGFPPTR